MQKRKLSSGLQQKIDKQQEVFKKKFTGDEVAKTLGEFKSEESGDKFAESFRFLYDKSIFEYELM